MAWLKCGEARSITECIERFGVAQSTAQNAIAHLLATEQITKRMMDRTMVYGCEIEAVKPAAPRPFKPLKLDRAYGDRYAQLQAERAKYPSKHI